MFAIEKLDRLPKFPTAQKYPWAKMKEKGDSFFVPCDGDRNALSNSLSVCANKHFGSGFIGVIREGDGYRVFLKKDFV